MALTEQQIDSLDLAFGDYLRAINTQSEGVIGRAICRLENVASDMGLRRNERADTFATRVLGRAGRY